MIFVTGGTGFVGQEVIRELLARGYRVRVLTRHPERAVPFGKHAGIEIVPGDVLKPETLRAAMAGVKAVIHLVGIIAETSRLTFEQAHTEATRHVLAAAKEAGVTRYIQMSAAGTRAGARSRYHITKWKAEEAVRQSGMDWTIFRPSLIYGYDERDRLLNLLRRALSWPLDTIQLHTFPVLNGGRPLIQPVSIREVAHCFARAVSEEAAIGKTYELVGPTAFSWREMVAKVARALGRSVLHEKILLALFTRLLLWLMVLLIPVSVIAGLAAERLDLSWAEIFTGFWGVALITALRWRKLIIYGVPSGPLFMIARMLETIAPRPLQFGEQLKMAEEDNMGDPLPASQTFAYVPERFEQGVARLLGDRAIMRSFSNPSS
jgi:NADH dehydrogenase